MFCQLNFSMQVKIICLLFILLCSYIGSYFFSYTMFLSLVLVTFQNGRDKVGKLKNI